MTNALRKAPQHTAVGFKQTVSGERAGLPWVGSETSLGLGSHRIVGCRTFWDVRPHGTWFGTSQVWELPSWGPSGMSDPMEFGLGPPRFWDLLGCRAPWSLVPWDLRLLRVRSRTLQGWAPRGWLWDLPGLAHSRMRSGSPQGWALKGQLWDLPGGTGLGPPRVLGPVEIIGAGSPRFLTCQGQILDLPGPTGTGTGLGSPGPHGES